MLGSAIGRDAGACEHACTGGNVDEARVGTLQQQGEEGLGDADDTHVVDCHDFLEILHGVDVDDCVDGYAGVVNDGVKSLGLGLNDCEGLVNVSSLGHVHLYCNDAADRRGGSVLWKPTRGRSGLVPSKHAVHVGLAPTVKLLTGLRGKAAGKDSVASLHKLLSSLAAKARVASSDEDVLALGRKIRTLQYHERLVLRGSEEEDTGVVISCVDKTISALIVNVLVKNYR